jgi:alkaline phosphatase
MTQMMTGVKTYNGSINVGVDGQQLVSFAELAAAGDRGIGVVTSVPLSHATPASAAGAHSASRGEYFAISAEVFESDVVDVWMGGGHPVYGDDGVPRDALAFRYLSEQTWASAYAQQGGWDYLDRVEEFEALAAGGSATAPRVMGLAPVASTLQTNRSGASPDAVPGEVPLLDTVPTLHTMAQGALRHLSTTHPDGFFLMVEGGAVDWAMHGNAAGHMIEEMVAFNEAVEGVVAWIESSGGGWEDNLVIITADHDHLFQGIPTRRDPLPLVGDRGAGEVPEHTWLWDNHSNHLVPVFARGTGAGALVDLADERDRRRGAYIQDTEIFDALLAAWALEDPR